MKFYNPDTHYDDIKKFNLRMKYARLAGDISDVETEVRGALLSDSFKAVTVCFSDIEGRLHMLDYDKDFLLDSADNLTFDGSSIRGFTAQHESDLKIHLDWDAAYILPFDVVGPGKLFMFAEVQNKDGSGYAADIRLLLRNYLEELKQTGILVHVAAEIEGFLFNGADVERTYHAHRKFEYMTTGGYFNALPQSPLRRFIDRVAEVQRAAGFENEKDHPEVAPSQFEINWRHTDALVAADQIQLYKMLCRQIASSHALTACFLPKPIVGVNGNGMHINISFADPSGKNLFFGNQSNNLSEKAWDFTKNVLYHARDICLALNSSVNAYRRLDPNYEAPNEIKASANDRSSMVRIPLANEKSARVEIRTVAPDANPYLAILTLLKAGNNKSLEGASAIEFSARKGTLPSHIYQAIQYFEESELMQNTLGKETHHKYTKWKREAADRCPRKLGTSVKAGEVVFHHEVTNQQLWSMF